MHESTVKADGTEKAVMVTSKGTVTLGFYPEDAPNTVASFIELARSGFYDGVKFHRVIPGFVAQAGDPLTRDMTSEEVIAGGHGVGTGGLGGTSARSSAAGRMRPGRLRWRGPSIPTRPGRSSTSVSRPSQRLMASTRSLVA